MGESDKDRRKADLLPYPIGEGWRRYLMEKRRWVDAWGPPNSVVRGADPVKLKEGKR